MAVIARSATLGPVGVLDYIASSTVPRASATGDQEALIKGCAGSPTALPLNPLSRGLEVRRKVSLEAPQRPSRSGPVLGVWQVWLVLNEVAVNHLMGEPLQPTGTQFRTPGGTKPSAPRTITQSAAGDPP